MRLPSRPARDYVTRCPLPVGYPHVCTSKLAHPCGCPTGVSHKKSSVPIGTKPKKFRGTTQIPARWQALCMFNAHETSFPTLVYGSLGSEKQLQCEFRKFPGTERASSQRPSFSDGKEIPTATFIAFAILASILSHAFPICQVLGVFSSK